MARATSAWRWPISVGSAQTVLTKTLVASRWRFCVENIAPARGQADDAQMLGFGLQFRMPDHLHHHQPTGQQTERSTQQRAQQQQPPILQSFSHRQSHQPPMTVGSSADTSRAVVNIKASVYSNSRTASAFGYLSSKICQPPAAIGSSPTASRAAAKTLKAAPRIV